MNNWNHVLELGFLKNCILKGISNYLVKIGWFHGNCGNWESFHKMGVKKSQKWRNIMKSANFYQIIWDPLQDAIFQKILILKHDFNYSYCPIEGFILIFYLCQTIKVYKSYQKVRFNLGDPVYILRALWFFCLFLNLKRIVLL